MNEKQLPLRAAVIGVGSMGVNHARVYETLKGVDLVAIVDSDYEQAKKIASITKSTAFHSINDLIGKIDIVSIATPSSTHADIGEYFLNNGIHCLIEKPLATTESDAQRLLRAAETSGATLAVGHIERFNPAIQQLINIVKDGIKIHAVDASRLSSAGARITDVDVILDLMVHDLDILLALIDSPVKNIYANGVNLDKTAQGSDYATALIGFENGALGTLSSSRITENKIRKLNVTTDQGHFSVDYIAQELLIHKQRHPNSEDMRKTREGNYVLDLATERVLIRRAEPLTLELENFVTAVKTGKKPLVTAQQALQVLRQIWKIQEKIEANKSI
jgi:predicted dehydrogenase